MSLSPTSDPVSRLSLSSFFFYFFCLLYFTAHGAKTMFYLEVEVDSGYGLYSWYALDTF